MFEISIEQLAESTTGKITQYQQQNRTTLARGAAKLLLRAASENFGRSRTRRAAKMARAPLV